MDKKINLMKNRKQLFDKTSYRLIAITMLFAMFISVLSLNKVSAAGTITGTVYIDYNMNGVRDTTGTAPNHAVDSGVSGVTVTAYAANGAFVSTTSSAVTGSVGTYSLNTNSLPAGPYRLEYTNLPSGYSPSAVGSNNASAVRFVNDGSFSNIDFGIVLPQVYCQNNPLMINSVYNVGPANVDTIVKFPYNYSEELDGRLNSIDPTNWTSPPSRTSLLSPTGIADADSVGATFGVTFDCRTSKLYSAAYLKRGANFGTLSSESTGAIYLTNNPESNSPTTSTYVDLNAIFGAGTAGANPHPIATTTWTDDTATIPLVGKRALGGLKISADGTKLYTVNLNDRRLYVIPTSGTLNSTTITRFDIPTTGLATSSGTCNSADVRPFALGRDYSGQIYVGGVCSAESETTDTKVHAYIWRFTGAAFTLVANNTLTFNRVANTTTNVPWLRWDNTSTGINRPSPMLTDIEFNGNDMILGLRDRYGDMVVLPDFYRGYGDIMRVCNNAGTFAFESNGTCGGVTTTDPGTNNNSGNGGREFYTDHNGDGREEGGLGGLTQVPGFNHVVSTFYDPVTYNSAGTRISNFYTSGVQRYNNTTGVMTGAYDVYLDTDPGNFGKANGAGDTEVLCDAAPLQVGNRVWNDANGNGVQDAGEANIPSVAVQFWADTDNNGSVDTQVGTATTDSGGNYVFGGANNTNLSTYNCGTTSGTVDVRVNASSDDAEQQTSNGSVVLNGDDLDFFGESNGGGTAYSNLGVRFNSLNIPQGATITNAYIEFTANNSGTVTAGNPTITIQGQNVDNAATFTTATNNISGRTWLSGQDVTWNPSAWTRDIAYQTSSVTNIVQSIVNRGGWASGNSMAFRLTGTSTTSLYREAESWDENSAAAPRLVVQYTTPTSCSREVEPNTAYEVRIPSTNFNSGQALNGLVPTSADADGTANGDSRDSDGIVVSGSQVVAAFNTGEIGNNNHTYDFGFRAAATGYSVGNRIWYDTNNDGIINAGEVGISGVSVSLFLDANGDGVPDTVGSPISTINTDANGYYRFDGLASNRYVIRVNGSNFGAAAVLRGYSNTANLATPTDDGRESFGSASNAENGVNPTGAANGVLTNGILSNSFQLSGVLEPQNEADVPGSGTYAGQGSVDNQADMTVDFGFYKLTLNGTAWSDTGSGAGQNNNGRLDAGENRLVGYRTRLYNSANVEILVGSDGILGTSDDATGGMFTNGTGDYNFMGMPAGDYRVVITSNGGISSNSGDANEETNPNLNGDSNDNGFPDNTGNYSNMIVSGIVTLTPGVVVGKTNNVVINSNGTTTDPTVDFGIRLSPTMVKLDKFEAYFDGSDVTVEWSTGDESGNLGFNVYRETNGQKELLTNAPIAGSALKTTVDLVVKGNNYRWVDNQSKLGGVYYIEDIDMNGDSTMHGPVRPNMKIKLDYSKQNPSKLLSDLVKPEIRSMQTDFVGEVSENESLQESSSNSNRQREVAAMKGVKLFVKDAGWYRVDMNSLAQAGFDINSNQSTWQMFVNGNEVPFSINNQKVEFYGVGVDTNITNEQVYYLVQGNQAGLRLPKVNGGQANDEVAASSYEVTAQRKDRAIYMSALLNGDNENWFGPIISTNAQTHQDFVINNPFDDGVNQARLRVGLQGLTNINHLVNISFNGVQLGTVNLSGTDNDEFEFNVPMASVVEGSNRVSLQSVGTGNDLSLVDTLSLRYTRSYVAKDDRIHFTVPANQDVRVGGFSDENIRLFEVENDEAVRELSVSSEKVNNSPGFSLERAGYDREFVAFSDMNYSRSVSRIEVNAPSHLNDPTNKADFVIIAPAMFGKEARELAERRENQGWKPVVVSVEDIYDEYSFGRRSTVAIKDFLRHASSNWAVKPRYVLLFGDSSYDQRNYLNQVNRDLIPTKLIDTEFMETSSDSWLADFDNDGVEDMALGRLPAGNNAEARQMLAKLERFDAQESRTQMSNLLVADQFFDVYADDLESVLPQGTTAMRVNRSQMSDAQMRSEIISNTALNPMVVTYTGHGTTGVWANSNVFRDTDVANLANNKLAFYMLMTCLNGYTHNAYSDSMAESLIKSENGAIAVWASSGSTYASGQIFMSRRATQDLFNIQHNPLTIGDLTRIAKQTTQDLDARRTWQLIGDPTIVVK